MTSVPTVKLWSPKWGQWITVNEDDRARWEADGCTEHGPVPPPADPVPSDDPNAPLVADAPAAVAAAVVTDTPTVVETPAAETPAVVETPAADTPNVRKPRNG